MPTHIDSTSAVATSTVTLTFPKPAGVSTGDWWYVAALIRGSVTVTVAPTGFDAVVDGSGTTSTTVAGIRLATYRRKIDGTEGADVSLTTSGNMFGTGLSWAFSGGDPTDPLDDVVFAADVSNDGSVASPSADATVAGTLLYRVAAMNRAEVFDLNDWSTADATRVESPAMAAGTNRVGAALAHESGPGSPGATGTEVWTLDGTTWGTAMGVTYAFKGATFAVDAGEDVNASPGELVELDFTATTPGAASYAVELTGGTYPSAHIITVAPGIIRFIAPEGPTTLEFTLTAGDGTLEGTDTVTVNVVAGSGLGLSVGVLDTDGHAQYD
jgi:hypothetical protein